MFLLDFFSGFQGLATFMGVIIAAGGLFVTVIGVLVAAGGLAYAGKQLREARIIAGGNFILHLDEMLRDHIDVHTKLRGGAWVGKGNGPESVEDWTAVELYMGLFERIKHLVDYGIIDLKSVERLYGYRIYNIVNNEIIFQEKLEKRASGWKDFINLCKDLKLWPEKRAQV